MNGSNFLKCNLHKMQWNYSLKSVIKVIDADLFNLEASA